jgi:hypothetical protein
MQTQQTPQAQQTEQDLMESITELQNRNRIHGELLTLDELVDPLDEKEIGEELAWNKMEIVDQVNRKEDGLVSDDEESDSNGEEKHMGYSTAIQICHQLEGYCLDVGG